MLHTILDNGTIIFNENDFKEEVLAVMGFEASKCVEELIEKTDEAAHKVNTDFRSYELQVESLTSALAEIGRLVELYDESTPRKRKNIINNISNIVSNNI